MTQTVSNHLPLPPADKTGWPWIEEGAGADVESREPPTSWPRISIVTPSYNQAAYLEATIRSVLLQNYPNLEYIVIDGGSNDGSVEIIRKYESLLTYWVSEKDRGQTNAINKGMARATGDIIAYLNSDDFYLPGTLRAVAEYFIAHPKADLVHGWCRIVDVNGNSIGQLKASITRYDEILDLWNVWWRQRNFVQPEVFWSKRIADRVGPFREDLNFVMDYDYWARILKAGGKVGTIDAELTAFRRTPEQKSNRSADVARELLNLVEPMLWERHPSVSDARRWRLQGDWLFDARFRQIADTGDDASGLGRWTRLIAFTLAHPKLWLTPMFRQRLRELFGFGVADKG